MKRIIAIGDTHNRHREVKLPEGDILIHAGDFTLSGGRNPYDIEVLKDFNAWLGEQPHRHKIVVPGNHDRYFEDYPRQARELITNARLVQDEAFEIEGLKMYASPWTPTFPPGNRYWKFNKDRGSAIGQLWQKIPSGLDVLITHGPPQGIQDFVGGQSVGNGILIGGEHVGDEMLYREVLLRAKPKIHIFGHIHPGYGHNSYGGIQFYNVSQCGDDYTIRHFPWKIDYEKALAEHHRELRQDETREGNVTDSERKPEADATSAA